MEINLSSDLEVGIYHYFVTPCQIVQFRNMTVDERVSANKGVDAHCFASGANFMHFLRVAPSAKGEEGLHSYRFTVAVAASNFSMRPAKEVSICANEVGDKRVPFKQLPHSTRHLLLYEGTGPHDPHFHFKNMAKQKGEQMPFRFEKEKILRWRDAKISPDLRNLETSHSYLAGKGN